jgi:superfamily II DNA or RNA helicase
LPSIPPFTAVDVRHALTQAAFAQAQSYQEDGRVSVTTINPERSLIGGTVRGSATLPYRVSVILARAHLRGAWRTSFTGACSCPVGFNCKHVGALLLAYLEGNGAGARVVAPIAPKPAPPTLSYEAARWLETLEQSLKRGGEEYGPDIRHRLIYVLTLAPDGIGVQRFRVAVVTVGLLKDGRFSQAQRHPLDPATPLRGTPAKYVTERDLAILRRLDRINAYTGVYGRDGRMLVGAEAADLLPGLLATGRCRWQSVDGPVLAEGPARQGGVGWQPTEDGRQRPIVTASPGTLVGVLTPPWYVDPEQAVCGPLELDIAAPLVAAFLAAPPLAREEADLVRARLAKTTVTLPMPVELPPAKRVDGPPVPRLLLERHHLQPRSTWSWSHRSQPLRPMDFAVARLSYLYGPAEIFPWDARPQPVMKVGNEILEIHRAPKDEKRALDDLNALEFEPLSRLQDWNVSPELGRLLTLSIGDAEADADVWLDFVALDVPILLEAGWRVDFADDFPYKLAVASGEIEAELTEGSGIDWFDLNLGVMVDGERVDILPALLRMMRKLPTEGLAEFLDDETADDGMMRIQLDDSRVLALPFGRVRPILRALTGLFDAGESADGGIRIRPADAVDLAGFEAESGLVWRGGDALRALGRRLAGGSALGEVSPPPSFAGTLRPYQQAGLAWLQLLREVGLGGVLADDMGLGKTVQILAHLAIEKAEGRLDQPCLVVAPTSLIPNWHAEAARFTPDFSVLVQHGTGRNNSAEALGRHDLVLTSYPLLARDIEILRAQNWHMVIADEAQFIKNPATTAAKALRDLEARHRLALSGTPLENHLGELWALFDFVSPGFLGDAKRFARLWRTPIEKKGDSERQKRLAQRVKPFLLRRTKGDVATELPPKTEITEPIELGRAQRDLYDGIRLAMHRKLQEAIAKKGLKRSRIELLDALLKLRQACCDPRLVKSARAASGRIGSAKLERLMEMIPELIQEGRRILLFSQFTSMLALIEAELTQARTPYVILTGDTTDRATPVARFQRGEVAIFLISLRAGGTGLNLTAADTVIHYDPWWNPAVEAQATDRAHRIGQDKPVFVHKLVAQETIEVKMAELKARKQALADGLFDPDGGTALDVTEADVEFLLGEGM